MSDELRDAMNEFIEKYKDRSVLTREFEPSNDLVDVFVEIYNLYEDYFNDFDGDNDIREAAIFEVMYTMYISRKYKQFTDTLLATDPKDVVRDVEAWKTRGRAFGTLGVEDVNAIVGGTYRRHTCNLYNATTPRALTYYMLDIGSQLETVCVQPYLWISNIGRIRVNGDIVRCDKEFSVFFVSTFVKNGTTLESHGVLLAANHRTHTWTLVDFNTAREEIYEHRYDLYVNKTYYPFNIAIEITIFLETAFQDGHSWTEDPDMPACPRIPERDSLFTNYCGPYAAIALLHRFCGTKPPVRDDTYQVMIDLLNLKEAVFLKAAEREPNDFMNGKMIVQTQISECKLLRTDMTEAFRPCG